MRVKADIVEAGLAEPRRTVAAASSGELVHDRRELGAAEALTNQAHLFGGLMAGGVLTISGRLTPELVRRALDWLQDEHPILRAHVVRKGLKFTASPPFIQPRAFFETRGTKSIPLRSVIDADPGAAARVLQQELRKPIPLGNSPRMKTVLVRSSETANTAQLIMCVDHTIADAQSAMRSMSQLLEYVAAPDAAPRPKGRQSRLPPALDAVLPEKSDSGRPYQPMIRLPVAKLPKTVVATAVERRSFSKPQTDRIRALTKSHGTTMHGIVTASVLKGIHERFGLPEMTVLSSVDLRRQCKPPVPMDVYGCFIDVVRTRHRIDQPLWALSQDVAFGLITTLARDHRSASALREPDWEMLRRELLPMIRNRFRGDGLVITTAGEINLGRKYGRFVLEDVTGMIAQETIGAGLFCMALERQGELEVSLCYSPSHLAGADAAAMADTAAALLRGVADDGGA